MNTNMSYGFVEAGLNIAKHTDLPDLLPSLELSADICVQSILLHSEPHFAVQRYSKHRMRHFPASAGRPEMMCQNFMREDVCLFSWRG